MNQNADAFSRQPLPAEVAGKQLFGIVAHLSPDVSSKDNLIAQQQSDPELREIIDFQKDGSLPADEKCARELKLSQSEYTVVDRVLFHVEKDWTLRIIPPMSQCKQLFTDAHSGLFGGLEQRCTDN